MRTVRYSDVAVAESGVVAVGASVVRAPPECTTNLDDDTALMARSIDAGSTWELAELPFPGTVRRVAVSPAGDVAALTAVRDELTRPSQILPGGCVTTFRTPFSDAVHLFTPGQDDEAREVLSCTDIVCTAVALPAPGVVVVGREDGTILRSDDAGETFTATALQPTLPAAAVRPTRVGTIAFANAETGYAVTAGAGIYRTDDGGRTWTEETSAYQTTGVGSADVAVAADGSALVSGPQGVSRRVALD